MKILRRRTQELQESKGEEDRINKDIRIMLIDDQELVRYGLRSMLEQEEDMEVVGDCSNAQEAFSKIARLCPDIVLMDIQMPGMNGIEATCSLKRNGLNLCSDIMILAESMDYRAEALDAGATGYLLKNITSGELAQTIRQVCQNRHSLEGHDSLVELVIPPPADATQLFRFMCELEDILSEKFDSIICAVGSWDRGSVISLRSEPASLLIKLANLPEVEKVGEKPLAKDAFPPFVKKIGSLSRSSVRPSKRIWVTLRETSIAKQKLVPVLT